MKLFEQKIPAIRKIVKENWEKTVRSISLSNTIIHCSLYTILAITSAHIISYLSLLLLLAIEISIFYITFYSQKETILL